MRNTKQLLGLAALALIAGCSSLNPFAAKDKTPPAPLVELKGSMAVRTAWTVPIGKALGYSFTPAVAGDSLLVAGGDGDLARIDTASGRVLWRIKSGSTLTAGVGTDGKMAVVAGAKGVVMAFDMDGKAMWKVQASSEVLATPVIGDGVVVVRSEDNRIVGLDAKSGEKKWTVQRTAPPLILRNSPGMIVNEGNVIVALPGGHLVAVTLATGAPRWEAVVAEGRGATELERVTDIAGVPVIVDKDVCTVAYQGRIGCFDLATGTARWTKPLASHVGVAADQRFVVGSEESGAVTAFARDTGASAWRNDKLAFRRLSAPLSYGRAIAVGDYQGYVHFLSREDGSFLARAATDGSAILASPVVAGSHLIFQTQSGAVTAIAVE